MVSLTGPECSGDKKAHGSGTSFRGTGRRKENRRLPGLPKLYPEPRQKMTDFRSSREKSHERRQRGHCLADRGENRPLTAAGSRARCNVGQPTPVPEGSGRIRWLGQDTALPRRTPGQREGAEAFPTNRCRPRRPGRPHGTGTRVGQRSDSDHVMAEATTDKRQGHTRGRTGNDRRTQIIKVATELFREKGYYATSLDDIADRIGFTKPAIYYYFKSKEDVLFAIVNSIVDEALERFHAIAAGPGSPGERIHALLVEHTRTILRNLDANTVFYNERGLLSPEREREMRKREREYTEIMQRLYAEGVATGELLD